MTDANSQQWALVRPFRSVVRVFGAIFDALYYFVESLINPGSTGRQSRSNLRGSGGSGPGGGPRIGTVHRFRGSAPNMNVGGCRSCQ